MSKPAQIKIVSDGTGRGTKIFDLDGKQVLGATNLTIDVSARGAVTAVVTFDHVALEMFAAADISPSERTGGSE